MFADHPLTGLTVPGSVQDLARGRAIRPVWHNSAGGLAFLIGDGPDEFVKWAPAGSPLNLPAEADRLAWASRYVTVPRPLRAGTDEAGSWLVTTVLPGRSAVQEPWSSDPRTAVTAIGAGLRALHETLPVAGCPFDWTAETRLADARRRAAAGLIDPAGWHEDHQSLTLAGALAELASIPATGRLVVCHGDSCAPNTMLSDDGRWSAHVDLSDLGVADRWADLAIATWSATWNYGPGWEQLLLDAYGIEADPERTRYYRLLWSLGP